MEHNTQRNCAVLWFHFFFGITIALIGWLAFASRWIPRIKPYHKIMGLCYLYGMIIMVYTATWISYNGFSVRVFIFGWICYGTMIGGHAIIRMFQCNKSHITSVLHNVQTMQSVEMGTKTSTKPESDGGTKPQETEVTTEESQKKEEDDITKDDGKTAKWWTQQRLKTVHGVLMFISLFFTTGAGIGFTRRFAQYEGCTNVYCSSDRLELDDGSQGLPICWLDSTS